MIDTNKDEFLKILREEVGREGLDEFIEWLCSTDFFTAPASAKFHSNVEGGLCKHSLLVYERMKELNVLCKLNVDRDCIAVCGLLHDVCKVNTYIKDYRNVKDNEGNWYKKPVWCIDDKLPLGHGEKSCILIQHFMPLALDELMAIRWHMGGYDNAVKGGDWSGARASSASHLVTLLQVADMIATSFYERSVE